ncbi:MAG: hypothetical protein ACI9N0_000449 [Ilumatobacter sp.]
MEESSDRPAVRNADVTAAHPTKASVEEQHHHDGDCTNTVERWLIRQPLDG